MTHGKHAAGASRPSPKPRMAQPAKHGAHAAPVRTAGGPAPQDAGQGRTPRHAAAPQRSTRPDPVPRHRAHGAAASQPRAAGTPLPQPRPQASRPAWRGAHAAAQKPSALRSWAKLGAWVAVVLALTWLQITFLHRTYAIPSGSMEHTIMAGDHVYAEKVSYYFREPAQGDIVTFDDPLSPGRTLIKRCIAVAGQTVDLVDGTVVVDGEPLSEPYTDGLPSEELAGSNVTYPYTVPEGSIWVMGDNRTNSQDSRYFGAIPVSSVTGRGALVFWPLEDFGLL